MRITYYIYIVYKYINILILEKLFILCRDNLFQKLKKKKLAINILNMEHYEAIIYGAENDACIFSERKNDVFTWRMKYIIMTL